MPMQRQSTGSDYSSRGPSCPSGKDKGSTDPTLARPSFGTTRPLHLYPKAHLVSLPTELIVQIFLYAILPSADAHESAFTALSDAIEIHESRLPLLLICKYLSFIALETPSLWVNIAAPLRYIDLWGGLGPSYSPDACTLRNIDTDSQTLMRLAGRSRGLGINLVVYDLVYRDYETDEEFSIDGECATDDDARVDENNSNEKDTALVEVPVAPESRLEGLVGVHATTDNQGQYHGGQALAPSNAGGGGINANSIQFIVPTIPLPQTFTKADAWTTIDPGLLCISSLVKSLTVMIHDRHMSTHPCLFAIISTKHFPRLERLVIQDSSIGERRIIGLGLGMRLRLALNDIVSGEKMPSLKDMKVDGMALLGYSVDFDGDDDDEDNGNQQRQVTPFFLRTLTLAELPPLHTCTILPFLDSLQCACAGTDPRSLLSSVLEVERLRLHFTHLDVNAMFGPTPTPAHGLLNTDIGNDLGFMPHLPLPPFFAEQEPNEQAHANPNVPATHVRLLYGNILNDIHTGRAHSLEIPKLKSLEIRDDHPAGWNAAAVMHYLKVPAIEELSILITPRSEHEKSIAALRNSGSGHGLDVNSGYPFVYSLLQASQASPADSSHTVTGPPPVKRLELIGTRMTEDEIVMSVSAVRATLKEVVINKEVMTARIRQAGSFEAVGI